MKLGLYLQLAWRNLKANHQLQIPFVLASSIMFATLYIMASLKTNKFVTERHTELPILMGLGIFIVALLAIIFTIYGQTFIAKRRSKEFSLYSILGFEKLHISMVILIEQFINFVVIGLLSIVMGQLVGTIMFKVMTSLLKDVAATLGDYPLSWYAISVVLILLAGILFVLYLFQTFRVSLLNPIDLMSQQKSGEKTGKFQWIWLISGLVSLGAGYYIAWTTKGLLDSISMFFIAVLLVMMATYFLFMTFISFVLNRFKKNKNYYYQPNNFLSISGMLYRIRSNAISLASIAVLSTGFMLALGSTISIYGGIEDTIKMRHIRDYEVISYDHFYFLDESPEVILEKKDSLQKKVNQLTDIPDVEEVYLTESININLRLSKDMNTLEKLANIEIMSKDRTFIGTIMTIEDYNQLHDTKHQLKEGEILLNDLNEVLKDKKELNIAGKQYQVKYNTDPIYTNVIIDYVQLVVPTREEMMTIGKYYQAENDKYESGSFRLSFDVVKDSSALKDKVTSVFAGSTHRILNVEQTRKETYQINGGFLFLGIMIGVVLLVGTVLMIYYKQITEGYDDKANFQVMKQVGLPEEMIKTTIKQQTFWLFALPIIVAVIHGLVASKIIFRLLGLFGIYKLSQFFIPYLIVITVFVVIYYIVYRVTSNVYYQIVNEE